MKRKQRKSLPWRWFGYRILISIKFCQLLLWISPRIMNGLRSHIKNSKKCFIRYPNTSQVGQKNSAAPRFSNPLLGVWISWWNTLSRVWYITWKQSGCHAKWRMLLLFSIFNARCPVILTRNFSWVTYFLGSLHTTKTNGTDGKFTTYILVSFYVTEWVKIIFPVWSDQHQRNLGESRAPLVKPRNLISQNNR